MKSSILLAAVAAEEHHIVNELPIDPVWIGVIAFVSLMAMLFFTLAFNGIAHRH
ncbi:hypothetical protein [Sediminivirga luteola]|jgi:hypothetical protein|uniref:Uncharacterized protein n=1 Tax=Sediminivirga luteola TaxID=1774748 RepID=A0A8J2TZG3_9MICO|nr:hypothetical protein [Sediminivirga luteola]MCI2264259.1 hypothetical protein [Sediminivirga luteola]GGA20637.1 hypothetical protein GCM10011333_24660 [Sediminivirga luteola]